VTQCMEILQAIIDSGNAFPDKDWINVPKTSTGIYTKCTAILRRNGLIVKRNGYYRLSHDIFHVLNKVQDRWQELVSAVERGENIQVSPIRNRTRTEAS